MESAGETIPWESLVFKSHKSFASQLVSRWFTADDFEVGN